MRTNPNFYGMVIFAFISVISFFQIDSYWADRNDFNGIFGWLGIGIVTALLAAYFAWRTAKTSTGRSG